jgi:FixJ family two-component response regulator
MTEEKPVVYVVDDDLSVLQSVDRLLRSAAYEVKTFTSALTFLDFRHLDAPGCLVLDVKMPGLSGLELQDRLADKDISFPVIFITGHGTIPISVQAMKAGAVDFLQKPFDSTDFLDAIAKAIDKDRQAKQDQEERKQLRERLEVLTPREYEVFGLVVTGMLNKQIAFDLGTTEKTIKVHRARVFEKMGAASLADLVRFAEKLGIRSAPI